MKKRIVLTNLKKQKKKNPNKIIQIGILFVCFVINATIIPTIIIPSYAEKKIEKEYKEIIKQATIKVTLVEDTTISFGSKYKVSDFITEINGTIIDDYYIKTTTIGEQTINFKYINEDGLNVPYSFNINVVDDIPPQIWLSETKSITTDYSGNLLDDIVCADNLDDNPKCEIVGEYNTKKVGEYKLVFNAQDNYGNTTTKNFTLKVKEPSKNNSSSSSSSTRTNFSDVIAQHKTDNTEIGLDVSSWQGDIDFKAVKNAGVEFVFIRVGSKYGTDGEYFLDKKFKQNIEGFTKVGIPVGIYFYSYANSEESAREDARWVLEQIKGYDIDLPIVYDWESWSFYNEFNQSFYSLSLSAKAFLDVVNEAGYEGLLYSSKNYLEKVWFDIGYDIWLAHYTEQTSYTGDYTYWQLCSNGKVDGISGRVDINIYYK